jgi:serine/threonine protein kinase
MAPHARIAFAEKQLSEDGDLFACALRILLLLQRLPQNDSIPETIAGWRILLPLGSDGLSMDYLAEREDGSGTNLVTFKVAAGRMERASTIQDFSQDIRMLEMLYDSNISRVVDTGWVAEGRPFVVTEFEAGLPITELSPHIGFRQNIQIFIQVLSAVGYAHQRRILDGSLEPSNILLTRHYVPRLVNFGLASAFARIRDESASEGETKSSGSRYLAPEQTNASQVSQASEVYALGAILQEILKENLAQTETKPSAENRRSGSHGKASNSSDGFDEEMSYILAKALNQNFEERYPNVSAFSRDLESYLNGRSVIPRQEEALSVVLEAVRRNLLTVLLVVGVMGVGIFAFLQRGKQEDTTVQFKKIAAYLLSAGSSAAKKTGTSSPSKLQQAKEFVFEWMTNSKVNSEALRDKAKEQLRLAEIELKQNRRSSSDTGAGIRSARQAYEWMLQLANRPGATETELLEAGGAATALAKLLHEAGDYPQAIQVTQDFRNQLIALPSTNAELLKSRAMAESMLSDFNFAAGDKQASLQSARSAAEQFELILKADQRNVNKMHDYVQAVNTAGTRAVQLKQLPEAMDLYRKAEQTVRPRMVLPERPRIIVADLARSVSGIGEVLAESSQQDQARKSFKESQQLLERELAKDRGNEELNFALADLLTKVARASRNDGNYGVALREAERSIQLMRKLLEKSASRANYHRQLAVALTIRGEIAQRQGNRELTRASFEEALNSYAACGRLGPLQKDDELEMSRLKSMMER